MFFCARTERRSKKKVGAGKEMSGGAGRFGELGMARESSLGPPIIGGEWRSGWASAAERGAVHDGDGDEAGQRPARALGIDDAVATRAWGCWRGAASWWSAA